MTATVFVRHPVNDYAAWKRVYDDLGAARKAGGILGASVHRDVADPKTVVVTHRFPSAAAAQGFIASPDLKQAMQRAGVSGPPTIWVAEDVETTSF